jgi:hypothetical protein
MKNVLIVCFCLFWTAFWAVDVLNETFNTVGTFPTGWTRTGPNTSIWAVVNSANAGGTAPELSMTYQPSANGQYRFISPSFDSRYMHDMTLSFRHLLDDYESNSTNYTIGVQISRDLSNWTTLWSLTGTTGFAATQQTVNISYDKGMSQTTYIAFWFSGNNYNIDGWYIDNVNLSYSNTLGAGNWAAGTYYPVGNIYVPSGQTFTIPALTTMHFDTGKSLYVEGVLKVMGDFGAPVTLTSLSSGSTWGGVKLINTYTPPDSSLINYALIERSNDSAIIISNSNKVRVSNCQITDNSCNSMWSVIILDYTDAIIENSIFSNNGGSGYPTLWVHYGSPRIRNNRFDGNIINYNGSMIRFENYNLSNFTGNSMIRNQGFDQTASVINISYCSGIFYRQMIANNAANAIIVTNASQLVDITNCLLVNNYGKGLISNANVRINSSILWGNNLGAIQNSSSNLYVRYSCIEGGQSGIGGTMIYGSNYLQNIASDPLFVNPTSTHLDTSDPTLHDWTLQTLSPCIDKGDPILPVDADGSIVDMGMYSRKLKPIIYRAADVANDQGHQLDLVWLCNDLDTSYQAGAFYSVWREGGSRESALLITSPDELPNALNHKEQDICWWDGDRTWYYLSQVPAVNYADYGLIVPTLQDSSSTGTHAAYYRVIYHNAQGYWPSVSKIGYSVDNIPPMAPRNVSLARASQNQYNLAWEEVTEGTWQGNSYPEINQVRYKVYASDDPAVPLNPANLIGTSSTPELLITSGQNSRFFRVLAFDTE